MVCDQQNSCKRKDKWCIVKVWRASFWIGPYIPGSDLKNLGNQKHTSYKKKHQSQNKFLILISLWLCWSISFLAFCCLNSWFAIRTVNTKARRGQKPKLRNVVNVSEIILNSSKTGLFMQLFGPPVIFLVADMPPKIQQNMAETKIVISPFLFKFHIFTFSGNATARNLSTVISTISRPAHICCEEMIKFRIIQEAVVLDMIAWGQGTRIASPTSNKHSEVARHTMYSPVDVL